MAAPPVKGPGRVRRVTALLASVDGALGSAADATISVTDDGLLRGDGVFEVIRLYAGRPFALEDHYERLQRSTDGLRLEFDLTALRAEVDALLAEHGDADGLLRLVLTRGGRRIALTEELPEHPPAQTVATVTYSPSRVLDTLKTLSYGANMLAGRLAREQGADEALFVTPHGRVLEGPTWTLFYGLDGSLWTPPLEERILRSITRQKVLETSGARERITTIDDLRAAGEAFIASTVREVMPIRAIDGRELPAAPGPLTRAAAEALREHVEASLAAAR
jgi:branched-chain amino acid aminotransferase